MYTDWHTHIYAHPQKYTQYENMDEIENQNQIYMYKL